MQPDLDEFDELDQSGFRWMSFAVLGLAIVGFFSLAWYAYQTGTEADPSGEVVVIKADENPVKVAPEERGGLRFPHQDKSIYDAINPNEAGDDVQVVTKPEEPVLPEADEEAETADKKIAEIIRGAVGEQEEAPSAEEPASPSVGVSNVPAPVVKEEAKPEPEVKKEIPTAPAPAPTPAPVATPAPAPAPVASPAPKVAAPAASGGAYQLQLGAFRSDLDARKHWQKLSRTAGDVIGTNYQVQKADLGDKGIFYRLRASGFASEAAAKAACGKLSARQISCFVVR